MAWSRGTTRVPQDHAALLRRRAPGASAASLVKWDVPPGKPLPSAAAHSRFRLLSLGVPTPPRPLPPSPGLRGPRSRGREGSWTCVASGAGSAPSLG